MTRERNFAVELRRWRERRGWSHLELAGRAGISQRHLSFLELARAAPVWRESNLAAPELIEVREALHLVLAQQEPFPAVVVAGTGSFSWPTRARCGGSSSWSGRWRQAPR